MVKTNSIKAWFLAARPVTLSAAAVPVMLGVALAYKDSSANCQWVPALLCLLFAWVMQIDSNLVNDFFDFKHGNDDETRLGPKRACAEGWITMKAYEMGHHLHHPPGVCHRFTPRLLRRKGDDHRGYLLRPLLFPLHHQAELSGIGRPAGTSLFRHRASLLHLLSGNA